jgi:hypothetical protein
MQMPKVEHLAEHREAHEQTQTTSTVEQTPALDTTKPVEQQAAKEQAFEQYKQVNEDKPDESPYVVRQASRPKSDQVMTDDAGKSPLQIKYEELMADGLETAYVSMTPVQQEKFRKKGEGVAKAIEDLTTRLKLTARKVLHLLQSWLKLIPGVNKYFLEQEAKLKTDEIMKLAREEMLKRKLQ